jgi:hypothetical protein
MLSDKEYIRLSMESNLFFLRIAKEHAIFAGDYCHQETYKL